MKFRTTQLTAQALGSKNDLLGFRSCWLMKISHPLSLSSPHDTRTKGSLELGSDTGHPVVGDAVVCGQGDLSSPAFLRGGFTKKGREDSVTTRAFFLKADPPQGGGGGCAAKQQPGSQPASFPPSFGPPFPHQPSCGDFTRGSKEGS